MVSLSSGAEKTRRSKSTRNRFSAFSLGPAVARLIPSAADARLDRATPEKTKGGGSSFHWSRQPSSRASSLPQAPSLGHKIAITLSAQSYECADGTIFGGGRHCRGVTPKEGSKLY